jgi:lysophospholipase L1-like esterase
MLNRARRSVLAVGLVACAASAEAQSGFQSFTTYVALGDSLTAGYMSSSLVVTHQRSSYPALIARQATASSFEQPLVSEPGIPAELALQSLLPSPVIVPKSGSTGAPTNLALARPYNNLGVPGSTSVDLLTRTTDGGGFHDIILRGGGTALQQAVSLRPTAITLWIGNNDVLGAVVRGRVIEGVTITPAAVFRATYQQIVTTLRATGASIAAANLPDVTSIPFVTTISRYVTSPTTGQPVLVNGQPVPLLGPDNQPLPSGAYVTLPASSLIAQGYGVPASLGGRGVGLPDEVVLDPNEMAVIRDRVSTNNQAIRDICSGAGIPVVDANAFLNEIATTGRVVGGIRLSSSFLTGGVFSYDGVHPNEVGYALAANEFIKVINEAGGKLPEVDVSAFLLSGARSTEPAGGLVEFSREAWEALLLAFPPVNQP